MKQNRRKIRGLVIDPAKQFSLVAKLLIVLFGGMFLVGFVGYWSLAEFLELVIELTGVPGEVREMLSDELTSTVLVLGGILVLIATFITYLLMVHTHRLHGAAFAIKRFVEEKLVEGDYDASVNLRTHDYLQDVAQSLNDYAEKMNGSKSDVKSASNQD